MTGRLGAMVLAAVWLGACAAPDRVLTSAEQARVQRGVNELLATRAAAFASRDPAAVRALYAEAGPVRWYEDGALRYDGVDAIVQAVGRIPAETSMTTQFTATTVTPLTTEHAAVETAFQTRIGDPADGGAAFGGVITMRLERGAGGWRIRGGHTSSARGGR